MVNYDYLNKEKYLPFDEIYLFEGVFVLWKLKNRQPGYNSPTWHSQSFCDNKEGRTFINRLVWEETAKDYIGHIDGYGPVDYVVINSEGKVLLKNFDVNIYNDKNNFIHIDSKGLKLNHYLKVIESKKYPNHFLYFDGNNFDELNRKVMNAVDSDYIKKLKNYSNRTGLTCLPIESSDKNIEKNI